MDPQINPNIAAGRESTWNKQPETQSNALENNFDSGAPYQINNFAQNNFNAQNNFGSGNQLPSQQDNLSSHRSGAPSNNPYAVPPNFNQQPNNFNQVPISIR